jgi:tetratricopeptide (TPR) repeat protein
LHYAVAHRNEILVDRLINQCNADVNGGDNKRPSILDMLQFNRERQEPFNRTIDDVIEQILLLNNAVNRCGVRSIINKRKRTLSDNESVVSNLGCLTVDSVTNTPIETAKNYARIALSFEKNGDINGAHEYYKRAMDSIPNSILDWANYARHVAVMYTIRGENQSALDLLQQALTLRKQFENETEEIHKIQHAIDNIEQKKI